MSTMTPVPPPFGAPLPPSGAPLRPSGIPKIFGTLNIVFGALLILLALCSGMSMLMQSAMSPMIEAQQQQLRQSVQASQEAQRAAELKKLEQDEAAAQTDEEKQAIATQRQAIESAPAVLPPVIPNMSKMYAMNDRRVLSFMITDMVLRIVLNILLIISGAWLVSAREWSRKLAIGVSVAKLMALFAMQIGNILVVAPLVTKQVSEGMEEMFTQMPPGGAPPPQFGSQFSMMMGTMATAGAVATLFFGSIYPILSLWFLTRREVKATCQKSGLETGPR